MDEPTVDFMDFYRTIQIFFSILINYFNSNARDEEGN